MESALTFLSSASACQYLPDRIWQLRYELVPDLRPVDYMQRLQQGWRRFGWAMFRPECLSRRMCQSLPVPVATFRPNANQRGAKRNQGEVTVRGGALSVSRDRLDLWPKFHCRGHETKGWPTDAGDGLGILLQNPFRTREWTYYVGNRLVAVAYVDALPRPSPPSTATTTRATGPVRWGRSTSCPSSPVPASGGLRTSTWATT
jgi:leucyl-tRNA---protein transferase